MVALAICTSAPSFLLSGSAIAATEMCHSPGKGELSVHRSDGATRITNIGDTKATVMCPVDLLPGMIINSARIRLSQSNGQTDATLCTLYSRDASGGQAKGVSVRHATSGTVWLNFPELSSRGGDFRYINCRLAPGAAIADLEITADGRMPAKADSLNDVRPGWINLRARSKDDSRYQRANDERATVLKK